MNKINFRRRLLKTLMSLSLTVALLIVLPSLVLAMEGDGGAQSDCTSIGCGDAAYAFKIDNWDELTLGELQKTHNTGLGGCQITISNVQTNEDGEYAMFDWSSTCPVYCVFVKGGHDDNSYKYGSGSYGDSGLFEVEKEPGEYYGISHVTFCFGGGVACEGDITVVKKINGDNPAGDVGSFGIRITHPGGSTTDHSLNFSNGYKVELKELPMGAYSVSEISQPSGYALDKIDPSSFTLDCESKSVTVTVNNETVPTGCIRVYKEVTGTAAGSVTGTYTFAIYDAANPGSAVASASITFNNGVADPNYDEVCGLALGKIYYVEETGGPAGTNVTPDLIEGKYLAASPCGDARGAIAVDQELPDCEVTFINDPDEVELLGTIGVEKVDEDGEILTGAGFTLYNSDKSVVVAAEKMVDASGKVAFKNLPLGTYIVSETTVPDGYEGMADIAVTIDEGNVGKVVNVTATNSDEGPPPEGEIEVQGMIEVLAFTGYGMINYIVGLGLALIGIIGGVYLTRMLKKKEK